MKQLTGLDASFLYLETAVAVRPRLEPLGLRAARRPRLRARSRRGATRSSGGCTCSSRCAGGSREVPFGLDHPYWIEDPDFDLDFHVRHTAVPPPGDDEQLGELVARIVGRPLDRAPPALGDLRHRGAARRPLRHPHQGPPRHRRRRLGRRAAHDDARRRPRRVTRSPPPERRRGEPEPVPSDGEVLAQGGRQHRPQAGAGPSCSAPAPSGSSARRPATRCSCAAANQVRASLRGPLGAVLNVGRTRDHEGEAVGPLPPLGRAPHAVQRADHARTAASRSGRRRWRRSRRSRTRSAPPSTTW